MTTEEPSRAIVFQRLNVSPKLTLEEIDVDRARTEESVGATTATVAAQQTEEKEAAIMNAPQAAVRGQIRRAEQSTSLVPRPEPVLALAKRSSSPVGSEFVSDWRKVGDSFVRDAQQFIEPVRGWLAAPGRSRLWKPESPTAIVAGRASNPSVN